MEPGSLSPALTCREAAGGRVAGLCPAAAGHKALQRAAVSFSVRGQILPPVVLMFPSTSGVWRAVTKGTQGQALSWRGSWVISSVKSPNSAHQPVEHPPERVPRGVCFPAAKPLVPPSSSATPCIPYCSAKGLLSFDQLSCAPTSQSTSRGGALAGDGN